MKYYLAIDIGASGGKHIIGWMEDGKLNTNEVYRFHHGATEEDGRLIWDLNALSDHVVKGIDAALAKYPQIESLAIDSFGCDYVLMKGDKEVLPCRACCDGRTFAVINDVHSRISFDELYKRTGIRFEPFNTIYQLYLDKTEGRLKGVTDFLMLPEYLAFKLTGSKVKEYTNAATTGLVGVRTKRFDTAILKALDLPQGMFGKLKQPKTKVGTYKGIKVILCASHDAASAVEGIDMTGSELYLFSGERSVLGVKAEQAVTDKESQTANYSNEGGVGYIRYQKNMMGTWIIDRLRDELCPEKSYEDIVTEAEESTYRGVCDINSPEFLAPESMVKTFDEKLKVQPQTTGDYFRVAFISLANSYKTAIGEIERNTGKRYKKLYIAGDGAKNGFLNSLTSIATGKAVIALPIETSPLGNLKLQLEADTKPQTDN